jgi:hypothetical protein
MTRKFLGMAYPGGNLLCDELGDRRSPHAFSFGSIRVPVRKPTRVPNGCNLRA